MPANEPQAGPVLRPFVWPPPAHFPYQPLLVEGYPSLPRNAIAHMEHAHHIPPVDYNACLNEQMNAAQNNRRHQRNLCRRQDRDEIRQQAQAELMAARMQPPQVPHIPDEPAPSALVPPAPAYLPIHYEGAVGPQNFNDPLHYFAPNPAPSLHAPPQLDYHQFNIQFYHHFQQEEMENEQIRNDFLQRQAQEAFHQQQIQLELQQQEARQRNKEAQYAFEIQQQEVKWCNRQAQEAHHLQQEEAEWANRQAQETHRLQQEVLQVTSVTGPPYHFPFVLALTIYWLALLYWISVDRILRTVPVPHLHLLLNLISLLHQRAHVPLHFDLS
ncbi:uncharacterized protein HD556DRAFT_1450944 [Suillus plorans]|uniref:Uncharacterized protein n=1 Tax=Suillus plorans TaxID=116603 RepID=A0A9P7A9X3_9AGAM|nr:uncharacterized protein HD556DRAFT_1450944 [Suillus plorans]KAG1785194.1 hypothetical protein HD556DRAFT_1450944 [Suillus plorans]